VPDLDFDLTVTREAGGGSRISLRGELDLGSAPQLERALADAGEGALLDLRGLTFMDSTGLHTLLNQSEYARVNRHNLAVVRGTDAIERLLKLTRVDEVLVLVDDPDDLVPPRLDR
jgi:anti-sigma B factor antagonist